MEINGNTRNLIEGMNRYYEARAPWHDRYMGYVSNIEMERLLAPIIGIMEETLIGKRVLEIACGTGNWTGILARRAALVVAADSSPSALAIAKRKLSAFDNVSLIESDGYDLSLKADSFEALFSADWWSHIPKQALPAFLNSAMRTLLSGSKVIFLDMSFKSDFEQEQCFYDNDNNRISLRKLSDGSEFRVVKNFPNEQELRYTLAGYGDKIAFYDFPALKRWMVILDLKR